jgi:hypothetical protein
VSNPVPVNKKQGTIRVCTDFHDLNKACPNDNFPTPFIDQIIDECAGCEAFSFILSDAPRSILDKTRQRARPHADGIVGSAQTKPTEQLTKQLQQLSIQHSAASQTTALAAPTQTLEVHFVQSTNPKAT